MAIRLSNEVVLCLRDQGLLSVRASKIANQCKLSSSLVREWAAGKKIGAESEQRILRCIGLGYEPKKARRS